MLHRIWLGFFLLAFLSGLAQWLFLGDADVFQRMVSAMFDMASLTVELATMESVNPEGVKYLNRLSDWFFVAGRIANSNGEDDVLWVPGANR